MKNIHILALFATVGIAVLSGCSAHPNQQLYEQLKWSAEMHSQYPLPKLFATGPTAVTNLPATANGSDSVDGKGFFQKAEKICVADGGVILLFRDTSKGGAYDHVQVTCKSGKTDFFKKMH